MIKQAPSSQASFSLSCEARCSRPLDAHEGAAGRVCLITDPAAAHSLMKQTTSNYVSGLEMYYADDKCLCLQCTVHESDDVRAKAIRLVLHFQHLNTNCCQFLCSDLVVSCGLHDFVWYPLRICCCSVLYDLVVFVHFCWFCVGCK
jgi:hypothetical protein